MRTDFRTRLKNSEKMVLERWWKGTCVPTSWVNHFLFLEYKQRNMEHGWKKSYWSEKGLERLLQVPLEKSWVTWLPLIQVVGILDFLQKIFFKILESIKVLGSESNPPSQNLIVPYRSLSLCSSGLRIFFTPKKDCGTHHSHISPSGWPPLLQYHFCWVDNICRKKC